MFLIHLWCSIHNSVDSASEDSSADSVKIVDNIRLDKKKKKKKHKHKSER